MDAKEYFLEGQRFFVEDRLEESIDAFTRSIENGERSELAFLSRGVAYFKSKKLDDAIHDFKTVINMNKQNYRAYFYRGTMYMAKGDYEKAIADFDETIKLRPDYGAAFFARGTAYAQIGNEDEARKSIHTAIKCSEASMQWVADHYGMFRTQFDKALAFITGESELPTMSVTDDQMKTLEKWLKER
jgi:Tfp pilus assembly protein PilF